MKGDTQSLIDRSDTKKNKNIHTNSECVWWLVGGKFDTRLIKYRHGGWGGGEKAARGFGLFAIRLSDGALCVR